MAFWSYGGKTLGVRIPPLPTWIGLIDSFSGIFQKFYLLTQIMKKYAIVEISTQKNCDTELCGFELTKLIVLLIFRILRHHGFVTILYETYEFRFEIRVLNLVCMPNFNS